MPRRVIDGEATLYTSRKLAQVQPPELRGHYAWFLPLALLLEAAVAWKDGKPLFGCSDPAKVRSK